MAVPLGQLPWATVTVNLTGSAMLGFVLVALIERLHAPRHLRPFVAIGFIGSYTTMSSFAVDADQLVRTGHPAVATAYLLISVVGGLACVVAGMVAGRLVPTRRAS
jgi:CrcB protein